MKIGTQLTAGAIAIGTIVVANLGVISLNSSEKDAKIINLSGLVRGGTQRAVKLELAKVHEHDNKTKIKDDHNHELIEKMDKVIEGLLKGDSEQGIPKVTDTAYLAKMQEVKTLWVSIEQLIIQLHKNPTDAYRDALLKDSEKLFELTDQSVKIAEENADEAIKRFKIIELSVAIFSLIIVGLIVFASRQIASTLDKFTNNIAQSSDDIASKVERQETVANEQAGSVSQTTS
ncbi:MAG: type IV pili methyl-accepting chemotaxis transducer N-terminal domain-containing protein, partial [Waterburya sp.]